MWKNYYMKTFFGILCLQLVKAQVKWEVDAGSYDFDFIYNFTANLHKIYRFNSFIIFRDSQALKRPAIVISRPLEQALVDNFGQAVFVFGPQKLHKLRKSIGLNNLAFIDISRMDDPMLDVVDFTLEGLHFMPMLFIFKRSGNIPPDRKEIHQFFAWCWSVNIVNVALTFQVITPITRFEYFIQNQVYNYTPFPKIAVHNLTARIRYDTIFLPKTISNVYGYTFNTPVFMDPPTVFLTPFEKHPHHPGEEHFAITGTAGRLYHEYIYSINGTIKLLPYLNESFYSYHKMALLLAAKNHIDISIHPFSELLEFANQTEGSYPLSQTNACIIVPVVHEINQSNYLYRTVEPIIWLLITLLAIGLLLFHFVWYFKSGSLSNSIGLSILYSSGSSYQQSLPLSYFKDWSMRMKLLHVLILLAIFVMQSSITTSLTSLLSTTVMGKQIETEEDFLESGLQIMLHEYEHTIYFDAERLPRRLHSRLYVTDLDNLVAHRDVLNTSYAYVVTVEQWRMLSLQQQNLWKHKFRIASDALCTANYFQKFPLQWDSPFANSISVFSMMVQESGLSKKWDDLSIHQASEMNLIKVLVEDQERSRPISISHLVYPFIYLICSYFIALLVFILEIFYYKKKNKGRVVEELPK